MAENRTNYKNQWKKEHTDQKNLTFPKGRLAEVHAAAEAIGEKDNEFILTAIDERMARLGRSELPFTPPSGEWCEGCKKLGSRQYIPAGSEPEEEKPWCYEHGCELDAPEGKARKCEKCAEKSRGA